MLQPVRRLREYRGSNGGEFFFEMIFEQLSAAFGIFCFRSDLSRFLSTISVKDVSAQNRTRFSLEIR